VKDIIEMEQLQYCT